MGMGPVYDEKKLEEIRTSVETVTREIERIKRNSLRYWILKFLSQHQGEVYKALILDELKARYRVVLPQLLMVAELKRQNGVIFRRGQGILVKVKKAEPWEDVLELAFVDE